MLAPYDYSGEAINDTRTRELMAKVAFQHGGAEYDSRYPDGIPTSIVIEMRDGTKFESGLIMYPAGHARNTTADLSAILARKFQLLARLGVEKPKRTIKLLEKLEQLSSKQMRSIYRVDLLDRGSFE